MLLTIKTTVKSISQPCYLAFWIINRLKIAEIFVLHMYAM